MDKKYYITYKITGNYIAAVEAENIDEAYEKAEEEFINANFGEAEEIEGVPIYIEDDKGNRVEW